MSDQSRRGAEVKARERLGRVLKDKWRLDALIGVGGMGAVYSATHRNGREVAIKILHTALSNDDEARKRFLREGYVANRIKHPGAVQVLDDDVDEQDGSVFLVMELLQGESVESYWKRSGGRIPPHEVLELAEKVLDVLAAAHDQGIVHRDIKPDNIFLTPDGGVKVLDFGIARVRELSFVSDMATRTGFFLGTPAFMAPEQARARWSEVELRTDLWAIGATMFTLLTGKYVHEAETVNELLLAAMTVRAPALASVMPAIRPDLAELVDRALAFDKRDRWPDARAMQAAVRHSMRAVVSPGPEVRRVEPAAHEPVAPTLVDPPPGAVLTTSRGVTSRAEPVELPLTGMTLRRSKATFAAGLVVVAAAVAVVVLLGRSANHPQEPAGIVSGASVPSAESGSLSPSDSAPATAIPVSALPSALPSSAETTTAPGGRSATQATAGRGANGGRAKQDGARSGGRATPAATTATSTATPARTTSTPPTTIDYDKQH